MYRRSVITVAASVLVAGCLSDGGVETPLLVSAVASNDGPSDVEPVSRARLENQHLERAVAAICDDRKQEVQFRVPDEDAAAVDERIEELPSQPGQQGSDEEYGVYVECENTYAVLRLLVQD